MEIKFTHPRSSFRKVSIMDMEAGTCFANAYHSPEKIMSGLEKISIYMKVDTGCLDLGHHGCSRTHHLLAVNLRNGNLYNLAKKAHPPLLGYVLDSELAISLVQGV